MTEPNTALATFAGGCFWCLEADFWKLSGVTHAASGYAGGTADEADYESVCTGRTGHYEAVQLAFDPSVLSYAALVQWFFRRIDPTDAGGQFCDRGPQYRTAIFAHDDRQRSTAETLLRALDASGRLPGPVATRVLPYSGFYMAEDAHLRFFEKNPVRYSHYRANCGRAQTLRRLWGQEADAQPGDLPVLWRKPTPDELRARLTPLQFQVTQENGTEAPFSGEYAGNKAQGIYVDIVSGEPLFSSRHKFDSGTGWPSFFQALMPENIVERGDDSHFMRRTEVRSKMADSHLGHVFADGPAPTGKRYCINSAALRFVALEDLEAQGYGSLRAHFEP